LVFNLKFKLLGSAKNMLVKSYDVFKRTPPTLSLPFKKRRKAYSIRYKRTISQSNVWQYVKWVTR